MEFKLLSLPFGRSDLEPFLSAEQVDSHYFGHHKAYVDQVNRDVAEMGLFDMSLEYIIRNQDGPVFNSAAQAWNHTFYWLGLTNRRCEPKGGGTFATAVNKKFGGMEGLREHFLDSASSLFGSGWTWLVASPSGELDVLNTQNADNPMRFEHMRPLWVCDLWEHAYYVDFRSERREYLRRAWQHINWEFIDKNYQSDEVPNMTRLMTEATGSLYDQPVSSRL